MGVSSGTFAWSLIQTWDHRPFIPIPDKSRKWWRRQDQNLSFTAEVSPARAR